MSVNLSKVAKKAKDYPYLLVLMRHAKTEATNKDGDEERELTDKGRKHSKKVAKALKSMDLFPDLIACSGATRARQTAERLLKVFGDKPEIAYRQSLYEPGMQSYIDEILGAPGKTRILMIVGHEPTMSSLAQWLSSGESKRAFLDAVKLGFSPASVAILGSDKPFDQWDIDSQKLIGVFSPKDC